MLHCSRGSRRPHRCDRPIARIRSVDLRRRRVDRDAAQRQLARLDAFVTKATGAFDASRNWEPDGARQRRGVAGNPVPTAEGPGATHGKPGPLVASTLPDCTRAWAEGDITAAQVDVIDRLTRRLDRRGARPRRRDARRPSRHLALRPLRTGRRLLETARRPRWRREDDEARRRDSATSISPASFGGMWLGRITLDPISGSIVSEELERLERAMFEADWAAARERARTRAHARPICAAPLGNDEPTRSSRWRPAVGWRRATGDGRRRCSAS